jgi:O-antigen/teichoic acid export membrane protein
MLHRQDLDVRTQLLRIFSYLTVVGYPLLSLLAILAYPIIVIIFGRLWVPSVGVAQILCFGGALALVGNVCQTYLDATGAVRLNFLIRVISVPLFVLSIVLGAMHSLEGAAAGSALAGGVMTLLSLYFLGRKIQLPWRDVGRAVLPSVIITALTALPAWAAVQVVGDDQLWGRCIVGGMVSGVCWLASLFLLRHHFRNEVMMAVGHLKQRFRRGP